MSQQNVEVIRRLFDAFNRQDAKAAGELWTIDGEWWPAFIGGGLVEGAVFRGHDGLVAFVEMQPETWESVVAEPVEIRELGDRVLVKVHLRAVGRASGIPVDRITWNVFELRDAKVATGRVYTGKAEALEAVGMRE